MQLTLTIYKDETLKEIDRTETADKLKIPYRVAIYIITSLENTDVKNEADLLKLIGGAADKLDKIIKATFGITDEELDCVDSMELGNVAIELYKWAIEKIKSIKNGDASKNFLAAMSK